MGKKLQNSFNDFLPMNFRDFKREIQNLTSNQATVASLLRICCEEDDVKAIKMAFERILGKPEKVIVIKRTLVRVLYPDATEKQLQPSVVPVDDALSVLITDDKVVIDELDAPGTLLKHQMDKIGEKTNTYAYEVVDKKNDYTVAEVMVANLYAIAMRGNNLAAIDLLFNYLDGAVADVVRIQGEDTILLENYADIAPYEAIKGEDGVYYIEREAVK